jgi:hypothetical protein
MITTAATVSGVDSVGAAVPASVVALAAGGGVSGTASVGAAARQI